MNKLTAEKCREQFEEWAINQCAYDLTYSDATKQNYRSMKTKAAWRVWQASRNAIPILEQQERGISCPAGYRIVSEKLTDEMLRRIVPNMAHSLPISHDEYDYRGRNERFIKWVWARLLELSETVIPERATNHNGEQ